MGGGSKDMIGEEVDGKSWLIENFIGKKKHNFYNTNSKGLFLNVIFPEPYKNLCDDVNVLNIIHYNIFYNIMVYLYFII